MKNKNFSYTNENYEEDCKIANYIFNLYFSSYEYLKEDLLQVALIGLCRAREKFDNKKATYSTYACKICFNEMNRFIYNEYYQSINQSLNEKIGTDNTEELTNCIEDKSFSFEDIDDKIVIYNAVKKYFKKLKESKKIIKIKQLILKGFSTKEIIGMTDCSHQFIDKIKQQFKQELKELIHKELY